MKKSLLIKNCQSYNSQRAVKKSKVQVCNVLNARAAFRVLLLMVGFSSLAYIFQVNQLATMGQEINQKEVALQELKEQNKTLEIKVAQLKASYHFESERERLNLVGPDQVSFVEIGGEEKVAMAE